MALIRMSTWAAPGGRPTGTPHWAGPERPAAARVRFRPVASVLAAVPMLAALAVGSVAPVGWATPAALLTGALLAGLTGALLVPAVTVGGRARRPRRSGRPRREPARVGDSVGRLTAGLPAVVRTHFGTAGGYVDCAGVTVWAGADGYPAGLVPGVPCAVVTASDGTVEVTCQVTRVETGGAA